MSAIVNFFKRGNYTDPYSGERRSRNSQIEEPKKLKEKIRILKQEAKLVKNGAQITPQAYFQKINQLKEQYCNDPATFTELTQLAKDAFLAQRNPRMRPGTLAMSFQGTLNDPEKTSYKQTEEKIKGIVNDNRNNPSHLTHSCNKAREDYMKQFKV